MTEYRVDELAREAGTTVRNVRAYQDRGLLPPPRREGRVGFYSDAHLARLQLIGVLLERGYTLANIAELMKAAEQGHDLGQLVGLGAAIIGSWSDEAPTVMTTEELLEKFGTDAPAEGLEEAIRLGMLEPEEDGRFRVTSPRLLNAGAELVAAGIPLEAVLDQWRTLRRGVDRIARSFVEMTAKHIFDPYGQELPPDEDIPRLVELIQRLRPLAEMAVDAELARAMERHTTVKLGELLNRIGPGQAEDSAG
jgi:DNA-binding transcriptional MerR regulator